MMLLVFTCLHIPTETLKACLHLQLAQTIDAKTMLKDALKALQTGIAAHIAKPLLAAEVRRIFPTAVGVPMELSLYSAAVAAATVKGRRTC